MLRLQSLYQRGSLVPSALPALSSYVPLGPKKTTALTKTISTSAPLFKFRTAPARKTLAAALAEAEAGPVVFTPTSSMKVAVFSSQPYVTEFLHDPLTKAFPNATFLQARLDVNTADLAEGYDAVCIFVNDDAGTEVIYRLHEAGVKMIALRCAGFDRVDVVACHELGIRVARVPTYSPEAVAEHAVTLMLALSRRIHKAYARTREGNFSLSGLVGRNQHTKTAAVIGTGAIGAVVCKILKCGFSCNVIAYDVKPNPLVEAMGIPYLPMEECLRQADVVTLHVPLLPSTQHMINHESLKLMKPGAMLINVSRGGLVNSDDVIEALSMGHLQAFGLDVFEHEESVFFEDHAISDEKLRKAWDSKLALLMSLPNVLVTPHSAFLTHEALANIAATTIQNLTDFAAGRQLANEVKPRGFERVGAKN